MSSCSSHKLWHFKLKCFRTNYFVKMSVIVRGGTWTDPKSGSFFSTFTLFFLVYVSDSRPEWLRCLFNGVNCIKSVRGGDTETKRRTDRRRKTKLESKKERKTESGRENSVGYFMAPSISIYFQGQLADGIQGKIRFLDYCACATGTHCLV